MYRILEYTLVFVVAVVLQVFLFNNLNLSLYVNPLIYVVFLVMLPMEIDRGLLLILGLLLGVTLDALMGTAGLNTIASLTTAFFRPMLLLLLAGKDEIHDGGVPGSARLGFARYVRYLLAVVSLHCLVLFSFESLTWQYYYLTFLRIILSTLATAFLIYWLQLLFVLRGSFKK